MIMVINCDNENQENKQTHKDETTLGDETNKEINKDSIEDKLNMKENIIKEIDKSLEGEGITYEELMEGELDDNTGSIISNEANDLTIILAYGIIASSMNKLIEEDSSRGCTIAKNAIKELNSTYKIEFMDVVNYCNRDYEYSDKKECSLIKKLYEFCY